ncbi:CAP domain-containing protein [Streptomyces sp. ISL-11]|uniref:CAP domain-containing protein n=1 Tax=Streptomyces sp. ISL-11 TaxID=2819174 RepID=UPI0027E4A570|nr:CAP domain-containing protein [Streptomyces sp. ISL-11]
MRSRTPGAPPGRRTADPGPPYEPDGPADAGRHRETRGRARTPLRNGLLGASAAMAMGVVAVASGLFSGGDTVQLGSGPGVGGPSGQVRADDPPAVEDAPARPPAPAPARGGTPVSRSAGRPDTPSTPSGTPSEAPSASPSAPTGGEGAGSGHDVRAAPSPAATTPAPASSAPAAEPAPTGAAEADTLRATPVSQVLTLVNQERAKAGLRPLTASGRLTTLAQSFSDDMARRGFFAHTDPDGRTPWDRAAKRGIGNLGGENIARGQVDARAVMDAWMRSSGHRANILNREYRTLGIGVSSGSGGPWWTQDFGY